MSTTSNADGDAADANETVDTKTKKAYKIHPFYRYGNVHFITTDDVLFSCHLDSLTEISSFFRDLSEIPQPPGKKATTTRMSGQDLHDQLAQLSIEEHEDIAKHTDAAVVFPECGSEALEPWLNLILLAEMSSVNLNITLEGCQQLYVLVDKYGCGERVVESLRSQILNLVEKLSAIDIFIFASQVDDKILGKKVLEFITNDSLFERGFHPRIQRLSCHWGLAVYQAVFKVEPNIKPSIWCSASHEANHQGLQVTGVDPLCYINAYGWKLALSVSWFGDVKL
ncbi:hypothetical protein L198_07005 [Cryptococcus wingfieldii CBS 7118]|uniref:BTB domain-containing protein n=1 Tax=Cryptococcus wingfieldii CBS 7118 TaxID=1295528 RepID=A0A1E3II17_9TREE|nr:hypothetical protein L198_07005 [Cryptococcus wingfieldii CBS 7118]ODN87381.1 hypothetical protein L198_07005 [Cryptococcus wingfieldii CBS 7118]